MKKLRILRDILRQTNSDKFLISYVLFVLADALVIWLVEPGIKGYFDALWFCYEVVSTTGFGELVVATAIGRIASVLLTVYSLLVIAIITGIVTNFYIQIMQRRQNGTLANFRDRLEHLPELSREELATLSEEVKNFRL